jgi:tRNA-binding protein
MQPASIKPLISKSVLDRVDIRAGTIEAVQAVPDADKLVVLRVNLGDRVRSIVAGMKQERANLEEIVGRQALFVVNLEPRTIRGMLSEGMLFDIGFEDGITPVLAVTERKVPDGSRAG